MATLRCHTDPVPAHLILGAPAAALVVGDTAIAAALLPSPAPAATVCAHEIVRAIPVMTAAVLGGLASVGPPPLLGLEPTAAIPAGGAFTAIKPPVGEAPAAAWPADRGPGFSLLGACGLSQQTSERRAHSGKCGAATVA